MGIDGEGNIWNTSYNGAGNNLGRVYKIRPDGTLVWPSGMPTNGVTSKGVAITGDGDAWVANEGSNTVSRLRSTGQFVTTIPTQGAPTGVAVDAAGKVWVTCRTGNSVQRINPATNAVDLT